MNTVNPTWQLTSPSADARVAAETGVPSRGSSRRSVEVPFGSAVVQTLALGGAAWITGSAAMSAQTAASAVDVAVQLFVLIGVLNSARLPDGRHPLGYGRDRSFWSMFAAQMRRSCSTTPSNSAAVSSRREHSSTSS